MSLRIVTLGECLINGPRWEVLVSFAIMNISGSCVKKLSLLLMPYFCDVIAALAVLMLP